MHKAKNHATSAAEKSADKRRPLEAAPREDPNPLWRRLATAVGPGVTLQPKLAVSPPDDPHEREADRVAEQVMRMPDPAGPEEEEEILESSRAPAVQRMCAECEEEKLQRTCAECEEEELRRQPLEDEEEPLQTKPGSAGAVPSVSPSTAAGIRSLRGRGEQLPSSSLAFFQPRFGTGLSSVRVHTGGAAAQRAREVRARAFTFGQDVVFGAGEYQPESASGRRLLAHELTHVLQQSGREAHASMIYRHSVKPTKLARKTRDQIFGLTLIPALGLILPAPIKTPALTLAELQDYSERQADWFAEPSLTKPDRENLWELLLWVHEGPHIRAGIGDVEVDELIKLGPTQRDHLRTFCRGAYEGESTVRIHKPEAYALSRRVDLGRTLTRLETLVPKKVLEYTVSQLQLEEVHDKKMMTQLEIYWVMFRPNLHRTYDPGSPGGKGLEFQKLLDLIHARKTVFSLVLLVLWLRNPHRFSNKALVQLEKNLVDFSGKRRLVLLLLTAHDDSSFQAAMSGYEDLITKSGNNVLVIEGAATLQSIIDRIPGIAASWGHKDAGDTRRINSAIIAAHGSQQSVTLAGMGAPTVSASGKIRYAKEKLHVTANTKKTQDLFDTLFNNMDPATAKLLFDGCLVGATKVPAGTAAADIPAKVTGFKSLGNFARDRASAAGLPPATTVEAARASTGGSLGLFDPATGDVTVKYPKDPDAYGAAGAYLKTGVEPEGLMRAAVEVGSVNTVTAETLLKTRKGKPAKKGDWWDESTRVFVEVALIGTSGAGIDLERVNELANVAETVFLARYTPKFSITAAALKSQLNGHAFAADIYSRVVNTDTYKKTPDDRAKFLRLHVDQAWLALTGAPAERTRFMSSVGKLTNAATLRFRLDTSILSPHAADLLTVTGAPTADQIRLALAWAKLDASNGDVRAFLTKGVSTATGSPTFDAAFTAEMSTAGWKEREFLELLGLLPTSSASSSSAPSAKALDLANAEITGDTTNDVFVRVEPHRAEVLPHAANVHPGPGMKFKPFHWVRRGDVVNVMGYTHNWAAIDANGKLGYVYKTLLKKLP